jgi:hypothetical protein
MATHFLSHPVHGQMTCGDLDASVARANGWTDTPAPTEAASAEPVASTPVPSFLAPAESDIPENFPARQFLIDGGVTKWADLVTKKEADLVALKGIGPATAREILEKLNS